MYWLDFKKYWILLFCLLREYFPYIFSPFPQHPIPHVKGDSRAPSQVWRLKLENKIVWRVNWLKSPVWIFFKGNGMGSWQLFEIEVNCCKEEWEIKSITEELSLQSQDNRIMNFGWLYSLIHLRIHAFSKHWLTIMY